MPSSCRVLTLSVTLSLAGCSLFPDPGPAPAQIALTPQTGQSQIRSEKTLQVQEPTAPMNFSGTKIIVQKSSESGVPVFTNAQEQEWTDTLPRLIQRAIVDHFKTPAWPGVMASARAPISDFRLDLDVRKFNIILGQGVEVSLNATLFNNETQKIDGTRTFSYIINSEHNVRGYVGGFNQAMAQFLGDLGGMLKAELEEEKKSRGSS